MAFTFSGTSGTNTATITQTGNYLSVQVTTAVSVSGANWSFTGTVNATPQAGATVADAVGRAVFNGSQTITAQKQIGSSWISSITSVAANAANVVVTGPRYFLSDGTEDVFQAAVGNIMIVCQNERDLVTAATTDTNFWVDTSPAYSGITGQRADIPWGTGKPNLIRLGTNAFACRFVVQGQMCISDNTHIMWAQGGNPQVASPGGGTLDVNTAGACFIMGRHYTLVVGSGFSTALLYPGVALTSDTLAPNHVSNQNVAVQSGAYLYLGGTVGGPVYGITTAGRSAATRVHFRKCNLWSVGNTVNTATNPTVFSGAAAGAPSILTCDELTLSGTHVLQREGPNMFIYSLRNAGGGFVHAVNNNAVTFNGYVNAGSQNGFDFGGYQSYAGTGGTGASILLSYDSTQGTNLYLGSADLNFGTGSNQNINVEMHRNLTVRAINAAGTVLTTPVAYWKDVTRTVTNTAANPRGAVSAAPDGTQATCGVTVTTRSGTTVLVDTQQVQYDRTYTALSNATATDVLLGECYTNNTTTAATVSRVGRLGYEANSGLATNRISRRGKDDTIASRTNRDNYDIYWWDYNFIFGKATDYSLNANATQTQILLTDTDVTQATVATTAAYTSLETAAKIYDYFKYYKSAPGSLNGRTQVTRLELGGVDGGTPGSSLATGGGGYLCYPSGSALLFNPIFSGAVIANGTNALPLQVAAAAQGPISGSWSGSAYTYGNAARATSAVTVQGGLILYAGATSIATSANFNTLNFGSIPVTLQAQATTAASTWASIAGGSIALGSPGTAASWTTTYSPAVTAGTGQVVLSGLGALVSGGSVTATGIVTSASAATTNTNVAAALQAVLPANSTVVANTTAGGVSGTINYTTGPANASGGATLAFTVNILNGAGTIIGTGTTNQSGPTSGFWGFSNTADQAAIISAIQASLRTALGNSTLTITGAATCTYSASNTYTINGAPAAIAGMAATNNLQIGTVNSGTGATGWAQPISTQSVTVAVGAATMAFSIPAVSTAVTPVPAFVASGTVPPGSAFVQTLVVPSTANTTGGTIFQGMSAVTAITNMPSAGTIINNAAVNFGSASQISLSGDITCTVATLTGTCTLNTGTTNYSLTLANCGNLTTFPFVRGGTGTISVLPSGNTVLGTLPAGFVANIATVVTLTLGDAPATAPTIRTAELYKNGSSTPVVLPTPTYANGAFTWNITSAASDVYSGQNGGIVFVDGYLPTRLTSSVNTLVSGTAANETNVDFGQTLSAADTAFVSTTWWLTNSAFLGSNAFMAMLNTQSTDYQTMASTRTAVEQAKLVWRRTYETSHIFTTAYRRQLAIGTIATNWISFSQSGVILNQISGLATTGLGLQVNKNAGLPNVITFAIWAVDSLGNFYNLNTANGRAGTNVTLLILWEGFSPGAVANLNTSQINQISAGVNTGLIGTSVAPGALRKIASGVNSASLVIPANINLDAAE